MPGDYHALRSELSQSDLVALSDADAAAKLASDTVSTPQPGSYANERTILKILGPVGGDAALTALETAAASSSLLARSVRILHDASGPGLDFGDPLTQVQLDQLRAQEVLTTTAVTALKAHGTLTRTRAEAIAGWDLPASVFDVAHARSL